MTVEVTHLTKSSPNDIKGLSQWTAVLLCALVVGVVTSTADYNEVALVRANNDFGFQWYKIRARQPGNVFISPFSAEVVLAMLDMGAEGNTFSQLTQGLHLPADKDIIANGSQSLLNSVYKAGEENATLYIANRIYSDLSFDIKESYKNTVMEYFFSDIVSTDFMDNPEQSRTQINQWVEEETHGRIQNLLEQDSITSNTRAVLVNAIYFKANWSIEFKKSNTKSEPFYRSCDDVSNIDMMHATDNLMYANSQEYQAVRLPYQGNNLHMLIILPNGCDDGEKLERVFENVNLTDITKSMRRAKVRLSIPKFRIEQTIDMNNDLKAMGIVDMFTNSANLSGISNEPIEVSTVVQKTFIQVSEEGTEAAAASGVVIVPDSLPIYEKFTANKPFIFVITHTKSGALIFIGKYEGE